MSAQALETKELESQINHEFYQRKKIKPKGCLRTLILRDKRYKTWILKSKEAIRKELDLVKLVKRQRMASTAFMSLLTSRQRFFMRKLSQMIIRDSSDDPGEAGSSPEKDSKHENDHLFDPL